MLYLEAALNLVQIAINIFAFDQWISFYNFSKAFFELVYSLKFTIENLPNVNRVSVQRKLIFFEKYFKITTIFSSIIFSSFFASLTGWISSACLNFNK
jgi:hypothetical protein